MNSLHVSLTEFRNESRVLKEVETLIRFKLFDKVYVSALHASDLPVSQVFGEGIEVFRIKLVTRKFGSGLFFKFLRYLEYCFKIVVRYKSSNINCVNVHSLGLLPLGVLLKFFFKARLVYDAHELETEANGPSGVVKRLAGCIERVLIKYVDMTIVVSESISDWYALTYSMPRPVVVLNSPRRRCLSQCNYFREQLGIREDQLIFLYQGALFPGRGVHLILEAFKARRDDSVVVVFMGYGELEKDVVASAAKFGNIFFYPAVSPQVVLDYTSSADVGVSLIEATCLSYYYCMPNKLFEYAMAGLPVIVSNMKEMSEFVRFNRVGVVADQCSVGAINQAIDVFLSCDLSEMKSRSYVAACKFSWEVQEQKMISAYELIGFSARKSQEVNS